MLAVLPGQSWLYGTLDSRGKCSGKRNAFLYPDLNTVLLGNFEEDKVIEAHESFVMGHTVNGGILNLRFYQTVGPSFRFWPSTLQKIRCPCLQEDPYERKIVYSGPSAMGAAAGDGLFVRKNIPAGTVVSFYNGIRVLPGEMPPFRSRSYQILLDWRPTTVYQVYF